MGALYSGVSITGYNANPPDDDGSQTEANRVKWETIKEKITDPTKVRTDSMDTAVLEFAGKVDGGVTSYSTTTQVQESDQGKLVRVTQSGVTITSPDAVDVGAPFVFGFLNDSDGDVTFEGHDTQTVDGDDSFVVPAGFGFRCRTNGSNWFTEGRNFPTPVVYPPAGLSTNLVIKVTGNTGLTVAADSIVVSDGTTSKVLTNVSHTINMATTGANALDTGSIAQATWYAIWEIAKADGTKAAIASLSATSPTMPTDYIHKARIGWVRTAAAAAQLMGTWQFGRDVQYKVGLAQTSILPAIAVGVQGTYSATAPTWTTPSVSNFVPPTASKIGLIVANSYKNGTNAGISLAPSNSYSGYQSAAGNAPWFDTNVTPTIVGNIPIPDMILEGSTVAWVSSQSGGALLCRGWVE